MTIYPDLFTGIAVTTSSLPIELDNVTARGVLWQAAKERFLLTVPGVAKYLVEAGRSITIEPAPCVPVLKIEYFMRMLPLAALLYQRGMLAFHAAAVSDGEDAVLLAGNSGSGKSTLLTALLQRGWRMLSDDLAIVGLDENKQPTVFPVSPSIALWPDSIKKLGIDSLSLSVCDANRSQYSTHENFDTTPRPLRSICCLSIHSKPEVESEDLAGRSSFKATGTMLYNSHVADALCDRTLYLLCTASIAQAVPIRNLRRPRGVWSVEALSDHIQINTKAI